MDYLYCGGRFDFDYRDANFEEKAARDYRAILLNDVNKLLSNSDTVILSGHLAYISPYYFETDGMLDQDIVATEKRQIERCTIAVFLLDDTPCPGTIAELVYAASLQKKILIYYVKNTDETESVLRSPFWYPMILCSKVNRSGTEIIAYDSYAEARDGILKWLKGYK
ncbi:MAG: nucleoside 2-deoxyribosyltransferase [Lachnospiraceae bacterium]|nr:nucleoside 2-deoxyribosyltransferase [Lachnospiraceae bacterium]